VVLADDRVVLAGVGIGEIRLDDVEVILNLAEFLVDVVVAGRTFPTSAFTSSTQP